MGFLHTCSTAIALVNQLVRVSVTYACGMITRTVHPSCHCTQHHPGHRHGLCLQILWLFLALLDPHLHEHGWFHVDSRALGDLSSLFVWPILITIVDQFLQLKVRPTPFPFANSQLT